jgi:hypothetical protein
MGDMKALDRVFNLGPFASGGNTSTVNQASCHPLDPAANPLSIAAIRLIRPYGLYSWRSRGIWSRTPHLTRLAPEGWKKDQEPQPFEVYSHCLTPFPARQCFPHGLQLLLSDLP